MIQTDGFLCEQNGFSPFLFVLILSIVLWQSLRREPSKALETPKTKDFSPQNRVPWGAYASAAGGGYSEHKAGAAVEKIEEKRQPEDFFEHRKRISVLTAPATKKRLKHLV